MALAERVFQNARMVSAAQERRLSGQPHRPMIPTTVDFLAQEDKRRIGDHPVSNGRCRTAHQGQSGPRNVMLSTKERTLCPDIFTTDTGTCTAQFAKHLPAHQVNKQSPMNSSEIRRLSSTAPRPASIPQRESGSSIDLIGMSACRSAGD